MRTPYTFLWVSSCGPDTKRIILAESLPKHASSSTWKWGPEYGNELEYLRTFVRQLRKKIEDDPHHPQYLLTDAYIGYRFNETPPEL